MATNEPSAGCAGLSSRQRDVITLLARGYPMKEIAHRLGITPRTVAFHKYDAMQRQGWRSNADLFAFALSEGLLER